VQLSASGTEYEFRVEKGVDRATVVVLEGSTEVSKGSYTVRSSAGLEWESPAWSPALLTLASYEPEPAAQEQYGRALAARAGEVVNYDYTFHVENRCAQAHRFTFHTSEGTGWLSIKAADNITISPHRTEPVRATVTIDATRLQAGTYRGRIYSECVDCSRERLCNQAQLEWPISLTVTGPTPTPTLTPTPTSGPFIVKEMEEATLTRSGADRPAPATDAHVLATLSWTNDVILSSQPTYHAQNLLPHFDSPEERSQSFRSARQSAVLERDKPGSNKTLGDVYSDWGQGAQAVRVYERERGKDPTRRTAPDFIADLGEAYRQTGQLSTAEATLNEAAQPGRGTVRLFNARGNLSLDRARVALDRRDAGVEVGDQLAKARIAYDAVISGGRAQPAPQGGSASGVAAVQTNLSETYLIAGKLALRESNAAEARRLFKTSSQLLGAVQQSDPFAPTDLGRAFQGLGDAARLDGKTTEANAYYAQAEAQHRQALTRHPDMAEAYFNLGDLFEDRGNAEAAKANYWQAVRYRPEQPDAYYPLAVLLQDENPQLAAELAATFLQLLPEVFKQGERAGNAQRILQGEKVTTTITQTQTQTPTPTPKTETVKVPDVDNDSEETARSRIEGLGLTVGQVIYRESCDSVGKVLGHQPKSGTKLKPGSPVNLTVGSLGENPVTLPNWVGQSRESVQDEISRAGLRVGRVREVLSEGDTPGHVLRQEPAPGTQLAAGCKVKLTVAVEPVVVSNYVGLESGDALTRLRGAGLTGLAWGRASQGPPGRVLEQSEPPGTRVAKGSTVILYVSVERPPEYVQVPPVVGLNVEKAKAILSGAGLRSTVQEEYNNDYEKGLVVSQEPAAGVKVRIAATTVKLTVSKGPQPFVIK